MAFAVWETRKLFDCCVLLVLCNFAMFFERKLPLAERSNASKEVAVMKVYRSTDILRNAR